MENKIIDLIRRKPKIIVYAAVAILVAGGYFAYQSYQKKAAEDFVLEETVADFDDKIPSQCESGLWTEFPNYGKTASLPDFKDNARLEVSADGGFTDEDGSVSFTTDENYSLTFFIDRDVRIEGYDIGTADEPEIYVKKIKCVGAEADVDIRVLRQRLMNHIAANINSLALEKSPRGDWQVQTFYFVNDTDLYVEYESLGSFNEDAPYDARLWLVRATKLDRSVPVIETLGYIQEDAEDPDNNVVKTGQDLYKDADNMTVYEYDDDLKQWILQ